MKTFLLHFLNYFFFAFHTFLIVFNLFGWLHPKTRRLNLYTLLFTFFSWGVLGIWKGVGYCFLTDWHYQVLRKLGESGMPGSYITFLIERFSGWAPNADLVYYSTLILATLVLVCSVWVNFFLKHSKE